MNYYIVTVGYETERIDRDGNPRIQKIKYSVQAESVEEANIVTRKYLKEDTRNSDILSINKQPIECVIDEKNSPKYYS